MYVNFILFLQFRNLFQSFFTWWASTVIMLYKAMNAYFYTLLLEAHKKSFPQKVVECTIRTRNIINFEKLSKKCPEVISSATEIALQRSHFSWLPITRMPSSDSRYICISVLELTDCPHAALLSGNICPLLGFSYRNPTCLETNVNHILQHHFYNE